MVAPIPQPVAAVEIFCHRIVVGDVVGLQEVAHILYANVDASQLHINRHALVGAWVERQIGIMADGACAGGTIFRVFHHRVVTKAIARSEERNHPAYAVVAMFVAVVRVGGLEAKAFIVLRFVSRSDILWSGKAAYAQDVILYLGL